MDLFVCIISALNSLNIELNIEFNIVQIDYTLEQREIKRRIYIIIIIRYRFHI